MNVPNDVRKKSPTINIAPAVGAVVMLAVFYLLCTLMIVATLGMMLSCFALYVTLIRIGIGLIFLKPSKALANLLRVMVKSLFFHYDTEVSIPLSQQDAPGLFESVERIARCTGVRPPREIHLQMDASAVICLRGYSKDRGDSILYLGYEIFTFFSISEIESIIAHEMAHVKQAKRFRDRWLHNGIGRAVQLAENLDETIEQAHAEKSSFAVAEYFAQITHKVATRIVLLFSACKRQDEFNADDLAARGCGTESMRSTLIGLGVCHTTGADLTWREFVIQSHREGSFSEWLHSRLTPTDDELEIITEKLLKRSRTGDFDTHPSLADRLAALPKGFATHGSDAPAIDLLADPDGLADRLLAEIERRSAENQRKDTKRQMKEAEQRVVNPNTRPFRFMSWFIICTATLCLVLFVYDESNQDRMVWIQASLIFFAIGGCALYSMRDRKLMMIPMPSYQSWEKTFLSDTRSDDISSWHGLVKARLTASAPKGLSSRKLANYWSSQCYQALGECDYQSALVASENCLVINKNHLEGMLGNAIALAYFGSSSAVQKINTVASKQGVGQKIMFELGWAVSLLNQWDYAEGYFLKAIKQHPNEAAIHAMLAFCQWQRDKLNAGVETTKKAIAIQPKEASYRQLQIRMLMEAGQIKEADAQLETLLSIAPDDREVMTLAVQINLINGRLSEAVTWADQLIDKHPGGATLCEVGRLFLDASFYDEAVAFYEKASASGFYPEALLGIAFVECIRGNDSKARLLLKSCLDVTRALGPDAASPLELLGTVYEGMRTLDVPKVDCKAWIAEIDMPQSPADIDQMAFLLFAPDEEEAKAIVNWMYEAMHPGATLQDTMLNLTLAEEELQPDEPVSPGIYDHRLQKSKNTKRAAASEPV